MTLQSIGRPKRLNLAPEVLNAFKAASSSSQEHYYTILLDIEPPKTLELVEMVNQGLAFSAWESLIKNTHFPRDILLWMTHIKKSTLYRRKEHGAFEKLESEQLVRVARVFGKALNLYDGNLSSALAWFKKSHRFLGGQTPLNLMQTETGAKEVEDLIGRMAHGVFS